MAGPAAWFAQNEAVCLAARLGIRAGVTLQEFFRPLLGDDADDPEAIRRYVRERGL